MKINVGSKNQTKIGAVTEILKEYEQFQDAQVVGVDASVEEFGHPKNLKEIINGAIARAQAVFKNCDCSIGIEGGLMEVPHTKTGFMELAACAIYDGENYHLGLSPAYEWPKKVTELILQGMDGSQALREAGVTDHPKIGTASGGIWYLTTGRMSRTDLNKLAIRMALIHLEHPEHF